METLLLAAAIFAVILGLAGILLPLLPGTPLVFAGLWLLAWLDDFSRVSVTTVVVLAAMAVLAWLVDYIAAALGVRRSGASGLAVLGAALGAVIGLAGGLVGGHCRTDRRGRHRRMAGPSQPRAGHPGRPRGRPWLPAGYRRENRHRLHHAWHFRGRLAGLSAKSIHSPPHPSGVHHGITQAEQSRCTAQASA